MTTQCKEQIWSISANSVSGGKEMGTGFTGAAKHIAFQRMLQGCKNTSQLLAKASRGLANQPEPPDAKNGFRGATKYDVIIFWKILQGCYNSKSQCKKRLGEIGI